MHRRPRACHGRVGRTPRARLHARIPRGRRPQPELPHPPLALCQPSHAKFVAAVAPCTCMHRNAGGAAGGGATVLFDAAAAVDIKTDDTAALRQLPRATRKVSVRSRACAAMRPPPPAQPPSSRPIVCALTFLACSFRRSGAGPRWARPRGALQTTRPSSGDDLLNFVGGRRCVLLAGTVI